MSENVAQDAGGFDDDLEFHPDAAMLKVTALIIRRRAALFEHGAAQAAELIACADDHLAFGARAGGGGDGAAAGAMLLSPPEIFCETGMFVGLMEPAPQPAAGVEMRRFLLLARGEGGAVPVPALGEDLLSVGLADAHPAAMAEVIRRPAGSWMVLHVEVTPERRRQGLATLLYDGVERVLGEDLGPSGWLSEDGYAFWRRRRWSAVEGYRRIEPFLRLWISPRELLTLMTIDRAKIEAWLEAAGKDAARAFN